MGKNKLILTPAGFKTWELVEDFTESTTYGTITVPKGKITDLASVPRILWVLLPPFGRYSQAAVIHDHLCGTDHPNKHEIFYEVMIKYKTWKWKAKIMYLAVKYIGGYRDWPKF